MDNRQKSDDNDFQQQMSMQILFFISPPIVCLFNV